MHGAIRDDTYGAGSGLGDTQAFSCFFPSVVLRAGFPAD